MKSVENFRGMVRQRLALHPANGCYLAGRDQLATIDRELDLRGRLTKTTYSSLTIGVMCAREFEQIDEAFCEAAYLMLEEVRPKD